MTRFANVTKASRPSRSLKVIPLGGMEEIGRNCLLLEYGPDMIIINMGLQFPEDDMPGIDYIVPNLSYVRGREKDIRGIIATNGHPESIGGIPYLYKQLQQPTVFAPPFVASMLRRREREFTDMTLQIKEIDTSTQLTFGKFLVRPFAVSANTPDAIGLAIDTPEGTVLVVPHWKFDASPRASARTDFGSIGAYGQQGVKLLCVGAGGMNQRGYATSEKYIGSLLETQFRNTSGKVVIGTFSSLVARLGRILEAAQHTDRRVYIADKQIEASLAVAKRSNLIDLPSGSIVKPSELASVPDEQLVVLCLGAREESANTLGHIIHREHDTIKLTTNDLVIFSSDNIAGNRATVQRLQDRLTRSGLSFVHEDSLDINSKGHAPREDFKVMLRLVQPEYLLPIGARTYERLFAKQIADELSVVAHDRSFLADNGQIVEIKQGQATLTKQRVPSDHVMVDGLGVGDVSSVVLRDRAMLAADGMVVVMATLDQRGNSVGTIEVEGRGFTGFEQHTDLLSETQDYALSIVKKNAGKSDTDLRDALREELGRFLVSKTHQRPLVLPVVMHT